MNAANPETADPGRTDDGIRNGRAGEDAVTATSVGQTPDGLVVLAVDDEAPALDEIRYLLEGDPRVGTVLTAANAGEALRMVQPGATPMPDAVLLDIAMPGWDGVDLARVVSALPRPPAVAFLSAHDDRAIDAYEIGALDYLLKPVRAARLAEAVTRFCAAKDVATGRYPPQPQVVPGSGPADAEVGAPADAAALIAVDLAGHTRFVPRASVCWAEAQGDYARLHVECGDSHLIRTPLAVLQEEWAAAGFLRVHRGYLVALHRIVELRAVDGGYRIGVNGGPEIADIPVSRRHLRTLKQRLLAGRRPGR